MKQIPGQAAQHNGQDHRGHGGNPDDGIDPDGTRTETENNRQVFPGALLNSAADFPPQETAQENRGSIRDDADGHPVTPRFPPAGAAR